MKRLVTIIYVEQQDDPCFNVLLQKLNLTEFKHDIKKIKLERVFSNLTETILINGKSVKPWFDYECGSTGHTDSIITCKCLVELLDLKFITKDCITLEDEKIRIYLEVGAVTEFMSLYYANEDYDHRKSVEENILKLSIV